LNYRKQFIKKSILSGGQKVLLDADIAELYDVTTSNLNKAVARNKERFPNDFMFRLTKEEYESLRFQIGILKRGQHSKYLPFAFTEQGIAMLSSVLRSRRAVMVNVQIMRVFTKLRRLLLTNQNIRRKMEEMEMKYDYQFKVVFDAIGELTKEAKKPKRRIGFHRYD
jgi:phage regulator Rha-like protein